MQDDKKRTPPSNQSTQSNNENAGPRFVIEVMQTRPITSYTEQLHLLRSIAESNDDPQMQFELAQHYMRGDKEHGIPADEKQAATWYTTAAEKHHAGAQHALGQFCFRGWGGLAQSHEQAVSWWRKAANQNHAGARHDLAMCYKNGYGVSKDPGTAFKLFEQADQENAETQNCLGECHYFELGTPQDYGKAVSWWTKAANQNHAAAQYNLATCYENGTGTMPNPTQALKWYTEAAKRGHADAQCWLATCYYQGEIVAKDLIEAKKWLDMALAQGSERAKELYQAYLASISGDNHPEPTSPGQITSSSASFFNQSSSITTQPASTTSPKDSKSLRNLKRRARIEKDANAQYQLSLRYSTADGVTQNYAIAVRWCYKAAAQGHKEAKDRLPILMQQCQKAADEGDAIAQFGLAVCYANGRGIEQSNTEAVTWYWKAAKQGCKEAQYNLAVCCHRNLLGVKQDNERAKLWYGKAADQGYKVAQYSLGICYRKGLLGVIQDDQAAIEWYRKAADQGHKPAIKALKRFFPEAVKSEAPTAIRSGKS